MQIHLRKVSHHITLHHYRRRKTVLESVIVGQVKGEVESGQKDIETDVLTDNSRRAEISLRED